MNPSLPLYVPIILLATVFLTVGVLLYGVSTANHPDAKMIALKSGIIIALWITLQSFLSLTGFYQDYKILPPKFLLAIAPTIPVIVILVVRARNFLTQIPQKPLVYLHTFRLAVELVLFWLFLGKLIPKEMTFEGRNYDIIMGFSAPLIAYLKIRKRKIVRNALILWNIIGIGFLFNIAIIAILSFPFSFQAFGFEQPNRAIVLFPFIFIPSVLVPLILFSHITSIVKLIKSSWY